MRNDVVRKCPVYGDVRWKTIDGVGHNKSIWLLGRMVGCDSFAASKYAHEANSKITSYCTN